MSCVNCGNPSYRPGETCHQCGVGPQIGPGGNDNFIPDVDPAPGEPKCPKCGALMGKKQPGQSSSNSGPQPLNTTNFRMT